MSVFIICMDLACVRDQDCHYMCGCGADACHPYDGSHTGQKWSCSCYVHGEDHDTVMRLDEPGKQPGGPDDEPARAE